MDTARNHRMASDSSHCRYCGAHFNNWSQPCSGVDAPRPTTGYESGMFKPGDKAPDGSVFLGETEDGSPLWSEPVDAPRPTSELAADVRERILEGMIGESTYWPDTAAAELDGYTAALVARVTDLEARLGATEEALNHEGRERMAAEAQVAALTQERDEARSDLIYQTRESQGRERRRLAAAAQLATTRQAVEEIAEMAEANGYPHMQYADIARRAIAATAGDDT